MGLVKKLGILGIVAAGFLPYSASSVKSQETPAYSRPRENVEYVPGELIVKFKEDPKALGIKTKFDSVNNLNDKYGVGKYEDVLIFKREPSLKKLTLDEKIDVLDAMKAYSNDPNVEYAEPDYILKPAFTPNDEFFDFQWAHDNKHTQAERGWDIERGNPNTVIAIIDTGIEYNHEDLRDNMLGDCNSGCSEGKGYDFVNLSDSFFDSPDRERILGEDYTDVDNDPMDFDGHGTAVAGVAAAKGNNGKGVAGVCHDCSIMPVRAGFAYLKDGEKAGGFLSVDTGMAIKYAADNGAKIINMSFGAPPNENGANFVDEWVDYAKDKGAVLIAAAGNFEDIGSLLYPAANKNVIAVAGTDRGGKCTTTPKIPEGRAPDSNYGEWIDVAAPCCNFTTAITGTGNDPSTQNYDGAGGTSISSAYVSGLAGLILSKNPELNRDEVGNIIREGADKFGIDIPAPDKPIGTGRVNVYKALQLASDSLAPKFIRGNSDSDNEVKVNISDAIFTLNYLFKQGLEPSCLDAADANDDGVIDISDPVRTILHLFDGRTLPVPYPEAGIDPTDDNLDCNN